MNLTTDIIEFELPKNLACPKPTELRGIERDDVRLLVTGNDGMVSHDHFRNLTDYLQKGDVLVVNTSATQAAAFDVNLPGNKWGVIHFSTRLDDGKWMLEIREVKNFKTVRWNEGKTNMVFNLPGAATVKLKDKYYDNRKLLHLWIAEFKSDLDLKSYMTKYGRSIQYENLHNVHPLDYYQTYFSFHPGSSEMPSAGRGFTQRLIDQLLNNENHL